MQYKKNNPDQVINLQSGLYCHFTDEFIVINDNLNIDKKHLEVKIDKIRNTQKIRLFFNFLYTSAILIFAVYSGFYPFSLLLFVSVMDLKQLKRYTLPLNLSTCIPIKNITGIKIYKGKMGFNYMDIEIENNGIKSLKPLKLYDSSSTFDQCKKIVEDLGKLKSVHEETMFKIKGETFKINEVESYILNNNELLYCFNGIYNKDRKDNYFLIRILSVIVLFIGTSAIVIKINLMLSNYYNYVDFIVLLMFFALLFIPLKYLRKAMPNSIKLENILKIAENNKYHILFLKQKNNLDFKVYLPKYHLKSQILKLKDLINSQVNK